MPTEVSSTDKAVASPYEIDAAGAAPLDNGLASYWNALVRGQRRVIVVALLGAAIAAALSLPRQDVYEASLTLEIQGLNENFLNVSEVSPTSSETSRFPRSDLRTHVRLLGGRTLAAQTAELVANEPPPGRDLEEWRSAVAAAASKVEVRSSDDSRIIELRTRSNDPDAAASFANKLAVRFIDSAGQARVDAALETEAWLEGQLAKLRGQLEESERRRRNYARRSGLLFTDIEHRSVAEDKLNQLQETLAHARTERIRLQAQAETAAAGDPSSTPAILDDGALRQHRLELADLGRRYAELDSLYTPEHYKVKQVLAQIAELERTVAAATEHVLARVRQSYEAARLRESLIEEDFLAQRELVSRQAELAADYDILGREAETNRELYETLLERVKQAGVATAMSAASIRVVDAAYPPDAPISPNHALSALMGLMTGLLAGVVWVVALDQVDGSLRRRGEAGRLLGVRELAAIVDVRAEPKGTAERGSQRMTPAAVRPASSKLSDELAPWDGKPSFAAECYRELRTSLLCGDGRGLGCYLVTSANPGEGKTTVAANLAVALTEIHLRVLLVDADLRRPRVHELVDLPNRRGLCDLIESRQALNAATLDEIQAVDEKPGLFVLPSGVAPFGAPGLVHSPRCREIFARLRQDVDVVIVDAPPMLAIPDARALARHADGVIMVVRAEVTQADDALEATRRLIDDNASISGVVLNAWNPTRNGGSGSDYRYASRPYRPSPRRSRAAAA